MNLLNCFASRGGGQVFRCDRAHDWSRERVGRASAGRGTGGVTALYGAELFLPLGSEFAGRAGESGWDRTIDTLIKSQVLYH